LHPHAALPDDTGTPSLYVFVCVRLEPFRQPNGSTMSWTFILGIVGIAVILYLIGSLRVLRQYERGVVFLLLNGSRSMGLVAMPSARALKVTGNCFRGFFHQ
jgi:hypothetical protein